MKLLDEGGIEGEAYFLGSEAQRVLIRQQGALLAVEGFLARLYLPGKGVVLLLYLVLLCRGLIVFL